MPRLTRSQMRCLHVNYTAQMGEDGVRSVDVAREIGVTKASVSRMMKLFTQFGLISMQGRGNISLTSRGRLVGAGIHDKVARIYPFFARHLGLADAEVLENTYSFLCDFSEQCVDRLLAREWAT